MSLTLRRLYTSTSNSATSIAAQFLSQSRSAPRDTQTQLLDANQLQRLSATLSRIELSHSLPKDGTPVPPGWHLAFFTPCQVESELGGDGSDTRFNPPGRFTRRMWAGGELEWTCGSGEKGKGNKLRVGQEVKETTRLVSAEGKRTRAGEEMLVVGVEKVFENEGGVALIDRRNWIFRPSLSHTTPQPPTPKPPSVPLPEGKHIRDFTQTPVTLFRFSALTFNAHKIHYNREWCREVEGHRDLVVHGPLNLISMLDFWRDIKRGDGNVVPRKISYRATSPLYVGERYRVVMDEEFDKVSRVRIVDAFGMTAMVGRIESF